MKNNISKREIEELKSINAYTEENIKKSKIEKRFQNIELDKCVDEIIEYLNSQKR